MDNLLFDVGIVIIAAALLAYVARLLRQPMVLGYIIAGFVIGPAVLGFISSSVTISALSELGIAFLLFIVGLEIDFKVIRRSGLRAAGVGVFQVVCSAVLGFALARLFGFSVIESLYVGAALTFGSTMVVVKLLSDGGVLDTLQGRLALGVLLVQDVAAIFVLALLPNFAGFSVGSVGLSVAKGFVILAVAIVASRFLLPVFFRISASSTELLFLSAVSWLFGFAFFAEFLGYSLAVGAFVAGVTLASSHYRVEVVSRVKSLRDFFATVFFVSLGMQLAVPSLGGVPLVGVVAFALFVIVANPLMVALLASFFGYNSKVSVMSGLYLGQVSEFSLILSSVGVSLGHIGGDVAAVIAVVAALTITSTTYVIRYDEAVYRFLRRVFHLRVRESADSVQDKRHDVVLCGYNRIGYSIAKKLKELGRSFVVVDFNPDIVARLKRQGVQCVYGDVGDVELLKRLGIPAASLVISTVPGVYENELVIREARKGDAVAIVTSNHIDAALRFYDAGADYVIMPHFLGGEHVALLLEKFCDAPSMLSRRFEHIRELHQRRMLGHCHPLV
ncbi:cation:proton antiporter [Candidatus Woesearchaeota archaeon]|nr:cation:proton antiporter [Candidatus Woesearchaeota archaeon]